MLATFIHASMCSCIPPSSVSLLFLLLVSSIQDTILSSHQCLVFSLESPFPARALLIDTLLDTPTLRFACQQPRRTRVPSTRAQMGRHRVSVALNALDACVDPAPVITIISTSPEHGAPTVCWCQTLLSQPGTKYLTSHAIFAGHAGAAPIVTPCFTWAWAFYVFAATPNSPIAPLPHFTGPTTSSNGGQQRAK